jgi:hypothetical protein
VERVCAYASLAPEDQASDDSDSNHNHMVRLPFPVHYMYNYIELDSYRFVRFRT